MRRRLLKPGVLPPKKQLPSVRILKVQYLRDSDGYPLCHWCHRVIKLTTSWSSAYCSAKCRQECARLYHPPTQRKLVFERDKGVCKDCGLNTEALKEKIFPKAPRLKLTDSSRPAPDSWRRKHKEALLAFSQISAYIDALTERAQLLQKYPWVKRKTMHLWEMDHEVPLSEGGKGHLSNLVTRCLPCHTRRTNELRKRLAMKKRRKAS